MFLPGNSAWVLTGVGWGRQLTLLTVTISPSLHGEGLYLVEGTEGQFKVYTVLMVSPIELVTRTAPARVLA